MKYNGFLPVIYLLGTLCASQSVLAHGHGGGHGGGHFGGFGGYRSSIGFGFGYGGYGPYGGFGGYGPYGGYGYAYPPVIAVPATPPVYIQRSPPPPPEPNFWYYCRSAAAYYPYVRECPTGWEQVAPQPNQR